MVENKNQCYELTRMGKIERVYYNCDDSLSGAVTKIILQFEYKFAIITANPNDDTIILNITDCCDIEIANIRNDRLDCFFKKLSSREILWSWKLINNQGYEDAIQLEFLDQKIGCENNIIIQFIAISSCLQVKVLKEVF